jgi:hypothetical protein
VLADERGTRRHQVGRDAFEDDAAAVVAGAGAKVDDPVGVGHHGLVVLDHDDRFAAVHQAVQQAQQLPQVGPVPPGGGLVISLCRSLCRCSIGFFRRQSPETHGSMEERIKYVFRMPRFPLLLDTGIELIAVHSAEECEARLPPLALTGDPRPVIDARAKGFAFYPNLEAITPLTLKKDWTKAEVVALYHARKRPGAPTYTRSLPARKLADVVSDIVALVTADRATTHAPPQEHS